MQMPYLADAMQSTNEQAYVLKRRKLRKGTTSCWECKHRKVRCDYDEDRHGHACRPCLRRGTACVGQELPAAEWRSSRASVLPFSSGDSPLRSFHLPVDKTQASDRNVGSTRVLGLEEIARLLCDALPAGDDLARLLHIAEGPALLSHELWTVPYRTLQERGLPSPETLLDQPSPHEHPVLVARHMLRIALHLQQMEADVPIDLGRMPETAREMTRHLVRLARECVMSRETFIGSIEFLECLALEALYLANGGNLRRAWASSRQTLAAAQLMGLDRRLEKGQYMSLDKRSPVQAEHLWFRIVSLDRHLSLLLGLSQGTRSVVMGSPAVLQQETEIGCLERLHCVISQQLLNRNEMQTYNDEACLQALDADLQKASRTQPSKWWLIPAFDETLPDSQHAFWDFRRLTVQLLHFNLLNLVYLPYLVCSDPEQQRRTDHARMVCTAASREVLTRFMAMRRYSQVACGCRSMDFVALMAAMTLVLAHILDSSTSSSPLAHQYPSDLALVEKVQEMTFELDRTEADPLRETSAQLLRRLLALDPRGAMADVAISVREGSQAVPLETHAQRLEVTEVHIPYFGIITLATGLIDSHRDSVVAMPFDKDSMPGAAADIDDWALQGVDVNFFESVLREDVIGHDVASGWS